MSEEECSSPELTSTCPVTGVLLMAHGSRRAEANDELRGMAEVVAERGGYPIVEAAFLELATPSIPEGGRACVARGAQRVLMLPYFLSPGRHVVDDLTAFQEGLQKEFPSVVFVLCEPLGGHPRMCDVILDRLADGAQEFSLAGDR